MSQFSKAPQKPYAKAVYARRGRLKQMVQESTMGHKRQYTRGETYQPAAKVCSL